MATKHISGIRTEKVEIDSSGNTWVLDKGAHLVSPDYGFYLETTANNSVIDIDGSMNASIAVYGLADKLKVNIGAGADVVSQLGVNMLGTKQFTANIDGDLFSLQYGINSAAKTMSVDVGKNGSVDASIYGIYSTGTGRFTANIDGDVNGGQVAVLSTGQKAKFTVGKDGSADGAAVGLYSVGTNSFVGKINGEVYGGQYAVLASAEKTEITLGKGSSIEGGVYGINSVGGGRFTAKIDGDVFGGQLGILSAAAKGSISIGNGVAIEAGAYGVYMPGSTDASVVNRGTVTGTGGFAIGLAAGEIRNFGDLYGLGGMSATGDKLQLVNEDGATIHGMLYGMVGSTGAGHSSKIVNHGLIITSDPSGMGIVGGAGDDKVINDGRVYGMVVLGDGNDTLDLRGGMVKGDIAGGAGDDTLITDKASHKLQESAGQGDDTVQASVTYKLSDEVEKLVLTGDKNIDGTGTDTANTLKGNGGDNVLKGLAGMDELFGGKGDDRMFGGDDADIFHFSKGDGNDTIADLETTVDDVDLSGWNAIQTFNQLKSHAQNDGNGNVVITAGGDSLTILDMVKNDLDSGDFTF